MGTALDALTTPQPPLNTRRPAASSLPNFELPPPNFHIATTGLRLPTHPSNPHHPPTNPSVSNLLTPPASTQSVDTPAPTTTSTLPTTATATTATAASTTVSASPDLVSTYAPSYWQSQSSYGAASSTPRQSWNNPSYPTRDTFSPSLNPLSRNPATSPPGSEAISPSYDMNQLPPFQQPLSAPSVGSIPSANPNHQHPHHQHHAMAHAMLTAQNALPNPASGPPLASNDYMAKSSSAPAYGGLQQLSSPPTGYSPYSGQPGMGIHPPGRVASNPHPPSHHHLGYHPRQPWPSYSLPAMNGPVMTNVHNPGSQMSLLGGLQPGILPGFNSGHLASMQQIYGGHPPHPGHAPGPTNDRPFKCDECPQSFNRNHDLKRHKRIHLAVKPFPCTHCDKSFSRKDALKRHILVKGCGKDGPSDTSSVKPERSAVKEEDKDLESNGHS
ncbi:hypothetical protein N8T08_003811 [Aspergillus melleus]|uniref:Uncharacterized protein n=1 Tax=Aspergillus melleus TaxID=138277 RepID=A0ACC3B6U0_9EURO|nr:hypothetical protein N8T08_003811 [Aspergillus melleus]